AVTGTSLVFELKAGTKRIVKVEVASFGFVFTQAGMVLHVAGGTLTGPDITGFTLTGTLSLDVNTTGLDYTFAGGGATVPGVVAGTYLKVKVTGALLVIPGATIAAT